MKITVATMDRAIQAAIDKPVSRATLHQQDRAIYLRGLQDAANVEDPQRDNARKNGIIREYPAQKILLLTSNAWDAGHDAHSDAIRETAKRLRREIKSK
jgi:hypothetical protein